MPHPPRLESARLILDAFHADDAPALFNYASQPEVAKWMAWDQHQTLEDSRRALDFLMRDVPGQYEWAIRLRDTRELVGGFSFLLKTETTAELHFTLAPAYWRRGLTTEAGQTVLAWAWPNHAKLCAIVTAPVAENLGALKVLERLSFSPGATRRSGFHKFSGGIDVIEYHLAR
jgi:ribosomal-protein-alanine N-acetyltransferase